MEFEASVSSCLDYLHKHLVPPARSQGKASDIRDLKIFFACGGNPSRWKNFLNIPKQMVDIGDGIPLIQRTINQFSSTFAGANFYLIARQDDSYFSWIEGAEISNRYDSIDRPAAIEVVEYARDFLPDKSDILWIYADVYFSDNAVQAIADHIS